MDRRTFTLGLASGTLLLGGCRSLVKPPSCAHFDGDNPYRVVDSHCHIFNATDLQVSGFIRAKLSEPVWLPLMPLVDLLEWYGWQFAPDVEAELRWLARRRSSGTSARRAPDAVAAGSNDIAALEAETTDRLASFFQKVQDEAPERLTAFKQQLFALYGVQGMLSPGLRSLDTIKARDLAELRFAERAARGNGLSPISFLATFFRYRTQNAWAMLQMYGCDSTPSVDLLCPALVDFDIWLGSKPTPSRVIDQVRLMGEISRATQGRVFAYAPFNPLRASCDGEYASRLFDLVERGCCAGFKMYPPMGFAASGNADLSFPTRTCPGGGTEVDGKKLDETLGSFFARCDSQGIPVMAHASPSNAATAGSERLADPKYWRALLGGHAPAFLQGLSKLRVSLGHMGGGGKEQINTDWRNSIVDAMERFPGQVYADLSYHTAVFDEREGEMSETLGFLRVSELARQQTMYGSDWSMLAMQSRAAHYLSAFESALASASIPEAVRSQVLGSNALAFLEQRPGERGFVRRAEWLSGN